MILHIIFVFLTFFAIKYELDDGSNAFDGYKPNIKDNSESIINKIEQIIRYDQRTIKWRRIFIASIIISFILPLILYQRIPTSKELLLTVAVCYTVIKIQWDNYIENISKPISKYVKKHLYKINKNYIKQI